jgi:hypothetical protein
MVLPRGFETLPDDFGHRLAGCGAPAAAGKLLQGLSFAAAATVMGEMQRRGGLGPVVEAMARSQAR